MLALRLFDLKYEDLPQPFLAMSSSNEAFSIARFVLGTHSFLKAVDFCMLLSSSHESYVNSLPRSI